MLFPMGNRAEWEREAWAVAKGMGMILVRGHFHDMNVKWPRGRGSAGRPFQFLHADPIEKLGVRRGDLPTFYANPGLLGLSKDEFVVAVGMKSCFYWMAQRDPQCAAHSPPSLPLSPGCLCHSPAGYMHARVCATGGRARATGTTVGRNLTWT